MKPGPEALHKWVYYLTAGFLLAACLLRSLLMPQDLSRTFTLLLLLGWLTLFLTESMLSARWRGWFTVYLILQGGLTALLLTGSDSSDFFAVLLAILAMQVMQRYPPRAGAWILAAFLPVMALPMVVGYETSQALVFVVYAAAAALVAIYSAATRRAAQANQANRAMVAELEEANLHIEEYAERLERLAVTRERHRLAHDLHDSVTQTIFSMTLTTQSALLLLEQDPPRVRDQLERLVQLTRGAQSEMQLLISELKPDGLPEGGLAARLRQYLEERASPQGLEVGIQAEGQEVLSPAEEQTLLRIAQEAVNNIIKHACASTATIRLHLSPPLRLEVEDTGQGFEPAQPRNPAGMGLQSMRERAAEIGWGLEVQSSPGAGTRVVVEKQYEEV
jgi:signal transduction histidine kinase